MWNYQKKSAQCTGDKESRSTVISALYHPVAPIGAPVDFLIFLVCQRSQATFVDVRGARNGGKIEKYN